MAIGIAALALLAGVPLPAQEAAVAGAPARHWAYERSARVTPPAVRDGSWVRNPVDRFVLARLEAAGVRPSPEADRATLIKRLTYDLVGLPPDPKIVGAFTSDRSPRAYEEQVNSLLRSPHFGER